MFIRIYTTIGLKGQVCGSDTVFDKLSRHDRTRIRKLTDRMVRKMYTVGAAYYTGQ
jgi:hypothetical protein